MNEIAQTTIESFDISQLLRLLPHRYPFLMVDRIIEVRGEESAIGIKNVTINEPQFLGHFPERPVMPGVLLIEGIAQTVCAICINMRARDAKSVLPFFVSIDKARFRKTVEPGDRVEFHVAKLNQRRNLWWYKGRAFVAGALVCEAEIGATLFDETRRKS